MRYKIFYVGTVAIIIEEVGGRVLGFTLPENTPIPEEFKAGEEVEISLHSAHPAMVAMGHNNGYYEITHIASGKALRTFHKDDEWKVSG
jgi:hypothetical protein